ncbi:MAG TPA: protocatechuate 3,4-dioxygenase subunit beta [Thermodesulfobacteriota bacterium]|nr:protocatechuate 3,4-dioxygenase subunit beta [Thermodesulfobacteriota bacterium]
MIAALAPLREGTQPPYLYPDYLGSRARAPREPLVPLSPGLAELDGPRFGAELVGPRDADLTMQSGRPALGERIVVAGRILDEDGRPVRRTLVELWQANAAGRYAHPTDQHDAPLDPNFSGRGRTVTDDEGWYRFVTIRPGAYPWRNHPNAWRPSHIHFSLFGPGFASRLVTQMYFPGDPLLPFDPIFNSIPDEAARARLVARFDLALTQPEWALGYRFDIVLRGRQATPMEG